MQDWNSAQYLKFEKQRTRPSLDLAKNIPLTCPNHIIDIGCGPGNSTAILKSVFPDADILGVDNSESMLKKGPRKSPGPYVSILQCGNGFGKKSMSATMSFFSTACIQWIPNHRDLIRNLLNLLTENGVLAVQIPMSNQEPLFQIIYDVIAQPRWGFAATNFRTSATLTPDEYFHILSDFSSDFDLWETAYYHRMPNRQALLEWVKGTRLRPYLNALDKAAAEEFEQEILTRAVKAYPVQPNGEIVFRFNRFFFTATR